MFEILENGDVIDIYSNDQLIINMAYSGSIFPSNLAYRTKLIQLTETIALELSRLGAKGVFSVDYLVDVLDEHNLKIFANEINARKVASTHPFMWTKLLTKARYDQVTGTLIGKNGEVQYRSSEYLISDGLNQVAPDVLIQELKNRKLDYDIEKQCGVFVHMISSLPSYGKIGATIIGSTPEEISFFGIVCKACWPIYLMFL